MTAPSTMSGMKRVASWGISLVGFIALAGCHKSPSMVGTWVDQSQKKLNHEIIIYSDGTYEDRLFKSEMGERLDVRGKWSIEDDKFHAQPLDLAFPNTSPERERELRKQLPPDIMKQDIGTITWDGKDEFTFAPLEDPTKTVKYKRKAEDAKASAKSK